MFATGVAAPTYLLYIILFNKKYKVLSLDD
jgi:hypothetical protein